MSGQAPALHLDGTSWSADRKVQECRYTLTYGGASRAAKITLYVDHTSLVAGDGVAAQSMMELQRVAAALLRASMT
jgi:hypothetical protein